MITLKKIVKSLNISTLKSHLFKKTLKFCSLFCIFFFTQPKKYQQPLPSNKFLNIPLECIRTHLNYLKKKLLELLLETVLDFPLGAARNISPVLLDWVTLSIIISNFITLSISIPYDTTFITEYRKSYIRDSAPQSCFLLPPVTVTHLLNGLLMSISILIQMFLAQPSLDLLVYIF